MSREKQHHIWKAGKIQDLHVHMLLPVTMDDDGLSKRIEYDSYHKR